MKLIDEKMSDHLALVVNAFTGTLAKALIVYCRVFQGKKSTNDWLTAAKVLEVALVELSGTRDVTRIYKCDALIRTLENLELENDDIVWNVDNGWTLTNNAAAMVGLIDAKDIEVKISN